MLQVALMKCDGSREVSMSISRSSLMTAWMVSPGFDKIFTKDWSLITRYLSTAVETRGCKPIHTNVWSLIIGDSVIHL